MINSIKTYILYSKKELDRLENINLLKESNSFSRYLSENSLSTSIINKSKFQTIDYFQFF